MYSMVGTSPAGGDKDNSILLITRVSQACFRGGNPNIIVHIQRNSSLCKRKHILYTKRRLLSHRDYSNIVNFLTKIYNFLLYFIILKYLCVSRRTINDVLWNPKVWRNPVCGTLLIAVDMKTQKLIMECAGLILYLLRTNAGKCGTLPPFKLHCMVLS